MATKNNDNLKSIGKSEAKRIFASKEWETMSFQQKVKLQLYTAELLMPWEIFHEAVEKCLNRGVMTHEFAKPELLQAEFEGKKRSPTMTESIAIIEEIKNKPAN